MLGVRIAALRRGAGMGQVELAAQLGVTAPALGAYEQGRRAPDAAVLVKLSEIFGVSIDYMLTGDPVTARDITAAARQDMAGFEPEDPREALIFRILMELL